MRRDINLMVDLIKKGQLFIEEFSGRPLLPDDLQYTVETYRPAIKKDIPDIAYQNAWREMLLTGRAFFVGRNE